jgi:hypothetical protein
MILFTSLYQLKNFSGLMSSLPSLQSAIGWLGSLPHLVWNFVYVEGAIEWFPSWGLSFSRRLAWLIHIGITGFQEWEQNYTRPFTGSSQSGTLLLLSDSVTQGKVQVQSRVKIQKKKIHIFLRRAVKTHCEGQGHKRTSNWVHQCNHTTTKTD